MRFACGAVPYECMMDNLLRVWLWLTEGGSTARLLRFISLNLKSVVLQPQTQNTHQRALS